MKTRETQAPEVREASSDAHPASSGVGRRDFLLSTATAGAGFVLGRKAAAQEAAQPAAKPKAGGAAAEQVNIAMIGLGEEGRVLMDSILRIPGIRVKAVCDIWEKYSLQRGSGRLKKIGHEGTAYVDYCQRTGRYLPRLSPGRRSKQ